MADTPNVKGIILTKGKRLITSSMTGFSLFAPSKYEIGDGYGFDPDENDTGVRGTLVYTGSDLDVQARQLADDTACYTISVPEGVGPFNVGNIMLYGTMWNNEPVPLFSIVLPFQYYKDISDSTYSVGSGHLPVPGNRLIINITIKHSLETEQITVNILTATFSSLPFYPDENNYPPPGLNPWTAFVIHRDSRVGTPALVVTDSNHTSWGVPCWQNIRDPSFGMLIGGFTGDDYTPDQRTFLFGQFFDTPDEVFRGTIGGTAFTTASGHFVGNLGGSFNGNW